MSDKDFSITVKIPAGSGAAANFDTVQAHLSSKMNEDGIELELTNQQVILSALARDANVIRGSVFMREPEPTEPEEAGKVEASGTG